MKIERTKNSIRNAYFGIINRIIAIVFPFVVRTIFIKVLGAEYLGLNSLFSSVLSVLSLTELGFSSAIVFCMYKPIADDDIDVINSLLMFYKKAYRVIGCLILGIGLLLIPFLKYFINGEYPQDINLIVVYLGYLFNTVLSYFMFAYLSSLITAHQREDMISKVNICITLVMYCSQIAALLLVKNYYVYLFIMPLFTVVNNVRTAIIARKMFPQYSAFGKLEEKYKFQIREKISGLVVSKVCQVSRNAFDSIFISAFLGLTDTAIYNNYYYIMNSVIAITSVLTSSVLSGVGNSIVTETEDKNFKDMNRLNFLYMWLSGWLTVCLLCLYQSFMELWVGSDYLFGMKEVILISLYFYVLKMGDIRYIYEQGKGLWWENRYRALAEAVANIILNYFLGKYFGISGIVVATLISLFVFNFCLGSQIIFKFYFVNQDRKLYYLKHFKYMLATVVVGATTYLLCEQINGYWIAFFIKILICAIVPNCAYWLIYRKNKDYIEAFSWVREKIKK